MGQVNNSANSKSTDNFSIGGEKPIERNGRTGACKVGLVALFGAGVLAGLGVLATALAFKYTGKNITPLQFKLGTGLGGGAALLSGTALVGTFAIPKLFPKKAGEPVAPPSHNESDGSDQEGEV